MTGSKDFGVLDARRSGYGNWSLYADKAKLSNENAFPAFPYCGTSKLGVYMHAFAACGVLSSDNLHSRLGNAKNVPESL